MRLPPIPLRALLAATIVASSACDDKPPGADTGSAAEDVDLDGDGFDADEDCDDDNADIHPSATEICDGVDNDCDGETDEQVTSTYYLDADEDGFGDPAHSIDACEMPDGYTSSGSDCDDEDPEAYPSNEEICDSVDNDCDG